MGEVYRAKDTRLDRTVAVKILPAHLSNNPEAKQRFEREARALSPRQTGPSGGSVSALPTTGEKKPFVIVHPQSGGQRFIFEESPESIATPLVLVTNWTSDLKK